VHEFQISALVLMDNIWFARNKLIFEAVQPVPSSLLKRIHSVTSHHLEAWFVRHSEFSIWLPPPPGFHKVNFDVAIRSSFAVAAATLRDHQGNFLAVHSLKLPIWLLTKVKLLQLFWRSD
jgi:hypothetical protein